MTITCGSCRLLLRPDDPALNAWLAAGLVGDAPALCPTSIRVGWKARSEEDVPCDLYEANAPARAALGALQLDLLEDALEP